MMTKAGRAGGPLRVVLCAVLCAVSLLGQAHRAPAAVFPDTGDQPIEIQQAIDYVTSHGYMNGGADGNFHPNDGVTRLDYAIALVKAFNKTAEQPDPSISFTDLRSNDPDFRYAAVAVKNGFVERFSDGTFKPHEGHWTSSCLAGVVRGMGLGGAAGNAKALWPDSPVHAGTTIVAHTLHLKHRAATVWPNVPYPRGQLAFTLSAACRMSGWRLESIKNDFTELRCQPPLVGPLRDRALDLAFSKLGYPYVWGGDADSEGGYDCSGLTYFVLYRSMGYRMMRTADDQSKDGRYQSLTKEQLLPGDPVFFLSDPGKSDYVGHAGMYVGRGFFIHSTGGNAGVSVESLASGYYSEHFANGKRIIDEGEPGSFDTYILLANPEGSPAEARVTYMLNDGRREHVDVSLEPYSRRTVRMDDTLVSSEASTTVEAVAGRVVAERSMYFLYKNAIGGGHTGAGMNAPARKWFLAEGCTDYGFDTYVLLQNPGSRKADVTITFLGESGPDRKLEVAVPPMSRYTVCVDGVEGMERAEFSTAVSSSDPIVVERSMYFDYNGIREGHCAAGADALSTDWFFAEGYTAGSFDTYLLLANPQARRVSAALTLQSEDGLRGDVYLTLEPRSRRTVQIDRIKGWESKAFSMRVTADAEVAAERAMYFNYNGMAGGHASFGSREASRTWFLAEGYTAGSFDTYVLVSNPNRQRAEVKVRFMLNGGGVVDRSYRVAARSRYTIAVDKVPGLEAVEVSTSVESNIPVVVERSEYFSYQGKAGGSCEHGVIGPAKTWYFAEGYTGM